jgi:hypothetical protein
MMPPDKQPKSRDELARGYFNMYRTQRQNQEKLAAGDITNEDLWAQAYEKAEKVIEERMLVLTGGAQTALDLSQEIRVYREAQETRYRELFEWNSANDEASLSNILDVESQIFEVDRKLLNTTISSTDRDRMMDRHGKLVKQHADLVSLAGIDRVSREKKKDTTGPIEDWNAIKAKASDHMEKMKETFGQAAQEAQTESQLRDAIKYHLGVPFKGIIDVILSNHRRVLNLDTEVQEDDAEIKRPEQIRLVERTTGEELQ